MILWRLIFYHPDVLRWTLDKYLTAFSSIISVISSQKTPSYAQIFIGELWCWRGGFNRFDFGRCSGYQPSFTNIVVITGPCDEKSIGTYNIIRFDVVALYFLPASTNIYILFHTNWTIQVAKDHCVLKTVKRPLTSKTKRRRNMNVKSAELQWQRKNKIKKKYATYSLRT